MALTFGELPKRTRGGSTSPAIADEDVAQLKKRPRAWAMVKENVTNAQKYTAWAKGANGESEGPWYIATRAHRNPDGTPRIKEDTIKSGKNEGEPKQVRYIDVWVCYSPDGKPTEL